MPNWIFILRRIYHPDYQFFVWRMPDTLARAHQFPVVLEKMLYSLPVHFLVLEKKIMCVILFLLKIGSGAELIPNFSPYILPGFKGVAGVGWGVFANFLKTAARQMKDEAIEFDAAQATFSSACSPRTTPYPVLHIIIIFFAEFIPSCVSPRGSANFHSQLLPVFPFFFFFFEFVIRGSDNGSALITWHVVLAIFFLQRDITRSWWHINPAKTLSFKLRNFRKFHALISWIEII